MNDMTENLNFEVDDERNNVLVDINLGVGVFDTMFTDLIQHMNNVVKLSELEVGRSLRTASIDQGVDTKNGVKDIIMYIYMENIGKTDEQEYNQIKGVLLNIEFVEEGEVTDTYLDFMNMIKNHYLEKSNHPSNKV